jgi:hypothetical protein
MAVPARSGDLPELEQPTCGTLDPYQRPAPPPLAGTWGERTVVEVMAAKQRGSCRLPLFGAAGLLRPNPAGGCGRPVADGDAVAGQPRRDSIWRGACILRRHRVDRRDHYHALVPDDLLAAGPQGPAPAPGLAGWATVAVAHRGRRFATAHAEIAGEEGKTVALAMSWWWSLRDGRGARCRCGRHACRAPSIPAHGRASVVAIRKE